MENDIKKLKNKKFHFIGIGGISMSALAQMLKQKGYYVQGSDLSENNEVQILRKKNIKVFNRHCAENLKNIDVVIYSSAIHSDNEELIFAQENNLIIIKRAELLGMIASLYKCVISISGSHGKTTTTGMISEMFLKANLKPTIHLGGRNNLIKSNYKIGNNKFFITEACEYMDNFLYINSDISVILNIDSDHLDYFKSIEGVKHSFKQFTEKVKGGGVVILNNDDKNSIELTKLSNIATFGINNSSDLIAKNIKEFDCGKFSFDTYFCGEKIGNIKLNIIGKHNIYNALACILIGIIYEIDFKIIKKSLEEYSGVERRSQFIGKINDAVVFHDYAHHPNQIEKMIAFAKNIVKKDGKIITVFEPHTFSRTKYLLEDFAKSLSCSNIVIFAPVYSARENEKDGANSFDLANETKKYNSSVEIIESYNEIVKRLIKIAGKNDVILILGAGTIEDIAKIIKKMQK